MSDGKHVFSSPAIVVITGASGGFGSALSQCFSLQLQKDSLIILTGRNLEKMQLLSEEIARLTSNNIKLKVIMCDLKDVANIDAFFEEVHRSINPESFGSAVLINNAGSLGNVKLMIDQYEHSNMKEYFDMNVTNTIYFTSKFMKAFKNQKMVVVNISSLCALKAFPSCGVYCVGKAARDMAFKVLASENPEIRVLNWAPGPMPTSMMHEMTQAADKGVGDAIKSFVTNQTYVECKDSASKLISLLKSNEFESGAHIDFYDI